MCSICPSIESHECGKCKKKFCPDHLKVKAHSCVVMVDDVKRVFSDISEVKEEFNKLRAEISDKINSVIELIEMVSADHRSCLESANSYRAAFYSGLQIVQDKIDVRDQKITEMFEKSVADMHARSTNLIDLVNEELKQNNIDFNKNTAQIQEVTNSLITLVENLKKKNIISSSTLSRVTPRKR